MLIPECYMYGQNLREVGSTMIKPSGTKLRAAWCLAVQNPQAVTPDQFQVRGRKTALPPKLGATPRWLELCM